MFEWISDAMATAGYWGLGFLMLIENVFPPIPSEVVMPLAGFLAAEGRFALGLVILFGGLGSLLGATFWYYIGLWLGLDRLLALIDRHGRWLTISRQDILDMDAWFDRKGHWAVLFGRCLPGFRTLISVPAGVARMPLGRFLVYSSLGTFVWISGLAVLGYLLQAQYDRVVGWLDPLSWITLLAVVGTYLWRVIRGGRA